MKVVFHRDFEKALRKLPPQVREQTTTSIALFARNPIDPILRNHALKAQYQGYRSIDITGDYRAVYRSIETSKAVFTHIGTHSQLYR